MRGQLRAAAPVLIHHVYVPAIVHLPGKGDLSAMGRPCRIDLGGGGVCELPQIRSIYSHGEDVSLGLKDKSTNTAEIRRCPSTPRGDESDAISAW